MRHRYFSCFTFLGKIKNIEYTSFLYSLRPYCILSVETEVYRHPEPRNVFKNISLCTLDSFMSCQIDCQTLMILRQCTILLV